jgi:para-nitrobenzyl esterase
LKKQLLLSQIATLNHFSITMKNLLLGLSLLFVLNKVSFAQTNNSFSVQTKIEKGIIEGNYDTKTGIQTYFGIPFAQPPVGQLRWKAPQELGPWSGVKQTKKFSARPIQKIVFGDMNSRSDGLSEDCLYLNVWTPAKRNTKGLPVLLYFYGGGNAAGDASEPRYDGESMAKNGIVVITCNYRLNVFGNFAHPELSAETNYKGSGNYGYLDQVAAMKWVQKNIEQFGGDPKKVTIAGESAGSIAVSYQMASPLAKGLIAGAIGESGAGINPTMAPVSLKDAETEGLEFAKKSGVPSLKQLRALSSRELYEMFDESKKFGFPVVIDGHFLTEKLPATFNAKKQANIPLLLGWNSAEIPGQAFMQGQGYTAENFVNRVKKEYPNDFETVLSLYPHGDTKEIEKSATALASDRFISYASWKWFDLHRNNSNQPVYRYLYSKLRPELVDNTLASGLAGGTLKKDPNAPKASDAVGAPHACEIEYCMGNLRLVKEYAWTPDDYKVSETMLGYFANFIKTGNPNGNKLPEWPSAKPGDKNPSIMIIDTESKAVNAKDDARYEFLDKAYGNK